MKTKTGWDVEAIMFSDGKAVAWIASHEEWEGDRMGDVLHFDNEEAMRRVCGDELASEEKIK